MKRLLLLLMLSQLLPSCKKFLDKDFWKDKADKYMEDPSTFEEIGSIDIGDAGAAEISAYDPGTKRLFVVNNSGSNKIDVIDLSNPATPAFINSITLEKYNGAVNSVDVHGGMLAAAIEAANKQDNGVIAVFNTTTLDEIKVIPAGALPDMVTFSPNGKYILTANEGEPSGDYTNDPAGTVTIVSVAANFTAVNLDFGSFASSQELLEEKGLRIFGPGSSFAQDIEPEYVTVSKNSKIAWVTLQENNAIARIDLENQVVTDIFPLGFKDYSLDANSIDPSDKDDMISFRPVPVFGIYMPDAIAVLEKNGIPFLFTANEGDAREYDAFEEISRVADLTLDETVFADAASLQEDSRLGRLNVTMTLGDADGNGKYEGLFSSGARSFSVWNGENGEQMYDSRNNLEESTVEAGFYDDGRSDDKGVEPEGLAIGEVGSKDIAFVGMERADAVALYNVSNPLQPQLLKILQTGDAPEGVLFVHKNESPVNKSLLIVSSEGDGVVRIYAPKK